MTPTQPRATPAARTPMLGRGWSFPVQSDDDGRLLTVADEESVRQSIEIILGTAKGDRAMRPDFGSDLSRLLFSPNTGATRALAAFAVEEALKAWEPRIELLEVQAHVGEEPGELVIEVGYRVRSTDNRFNLVYPFYLDRALA